jgi:hypothetical protein
MSICSYQTTSIIINESEEFHPHHEHSDLLLNQNSDLFLFGMLVHKRRLFILQDQNLRSSYSGPLSGQDFSRAQNLPNQVTKKLYFLFWSNVYAYVLVLFFNEMDIKRKKSRGAVLSVSIAKRILFQAIRLSVECGCSLNDMMVNQV